MNQPQYPYPPSYQPPPQQESSAIVTVLIVLGLLVVVGGILSVLAIFGVRKYLAEAKSVEARNSIGQIAKLAQEHYEESGKLCPSASAPVPADASSIRGKKYLSASNEWMRDQSKNAGFACLKFEMSSPQYFQYDYQATPTGFTAIAHGDLNGDGELSEYSIAGAVQNGKLVVSQSILEKNAGE